MGRQEKHHGLVPLRGAGFGSRSAVRLHYSDCLVSRSHPVAAQNTRNLPFGPPIVYVTDARFDEIGAADTGTPEG